MQKKKLSILVLLLAVLLAGCMYPQSQKVENTVPNDMQLQSVQTAVDQFRQDTEGLLPIKNQEADVPYYQKYPIDFQKLIGKYLEDAPGNAYENGGPFQYVLIDVEENPLVRVLDLRAAQLIQEYNLRLTMYMDSNPYLPFKEQLHTNVFTLDYEALGYNEVPLIQSPFSEAQLPIVIDSKGDLYIDYTADLKASLDDGAIVEPGEDIRYILTEDSIFVPAFSLPYTTDENNIPVFMPN
ncbi:hypothetical protein IEO70_18830 [Bacillus sp. AGMB 02131]|uniref:ABC transporter periplasmic binding protein yphF n=1 Tax=Peribacillus faecalis TaxID=2772559 RepID=A0A927D3F5_9BACI|nr:hypothetical protein [Peribacillus faecalis]